jgi:DNA-binding transcriptional MocR family regulator
VPTLSNPLGASMPLAERRRLARMAAQRGVPVIEDVIYNDLSEQDDRRRSVHSFDEGGNVMLCGSFTKTLAPGIRLGWVAAGRWHAQVQRMKAATSGGQSTVLDLRATIAARVDEAREIIAQGFPRGTRVTDPPGGFILWAEFPEGVDTLELWRRCLDERICFARGNMFSASDRFGRFARFGVGGRWDDAQRAALRRIGELATGMLAHGGRAGTADA